MLRKICFFAILALLVASCGTHQTEKLSFKVSPLEPGGRIDAIDYWGNGVVIAGTRNPNPGNVYKSEDFGATWHKVGNVTGTDYITCLRAAQNGVGYLLTGQNVHVWKTTDYGETWRNLGQVSHAFNGYYANAYGLWVTNKGTVLVADADSAGGHIHRSADGGETWHDVGCISPRALYRLNGVGDGVLVNGWAFHIYKSTDDGLTWQDEGKIADSDLYAIEYLGNGIALIGTKNGRIFQSRDNGVTWKEQCVLEGSADDFAWLGDNRVLYSTYTGKRNLYLSEDAGASWTYIGDVETGAPGDWLDHVIGIRDQGVHVVVGGTNKGFILYSRLP